MVRQAPKSKKPTKSNPSLVREMSRAYAKIVYNIGSSWVRYSDGNSDLFGCNYESVTEIEGENNVKIFFKVHLKKELHDSKDCTASILIPKGTRFSEESEKRFNRNVKLINNLLMQDYKEQYRLSGGNFYRDDLFSRVSVKKLLCSKHPLKRTKDNLWTLNFVPPSIESDGRWGHWGVWHPLLVFSYLMGKQFAYPKTLNHDEIRAKYYHDSWDENGEHVEDPDDDKTQSWKYIVLEGFKHVGFWKDGSRRLDV